MFPFLVKSGIAGKRYFLNKTHATLSINSSFESIRRFKICVFVNSGSVYNKSGNFPQLTNNYKMIQKGFEINVRYLDICEFNV